MNRKSNPSRWPVASGPWFLSLALMAGVAPVPLDGGSEPAAREGAPAPPAAHPGHAAPASAGSAGAATPEARRADLAAFKTDFLARDRSYSQTARQEAEARLARLESAAAVVSQAYFELELARIVGLADNGHTAFFAGPRSRRYNRVGIRLVPLAGDFYVLRARDTNADLLGARLVAIDDQPIDAIREAARTLSGGIPAWRDRSAPYFFESPEQLHALGLIARPDAATYRFAAADGGVLERRLVPEPASADRPRGNADRWLYPQLMDTEAGQWKTLVAPEKAPWALQDPESAFRWREAPEIGALVVQLRQNASRDKQSIDKFLAEVTRRIRERPPRNLVLDMRLNGGGDLNETRDFAESLPKLVPGRIFALTSPWTFSAAISTVGYLEQAAPERVAIVGEPVGDRLQMWSEGDIVTLPHSGAVMLDATERHDYLTGCRPFKDCHGAVVRHPISVRSLDPDIAAGWTIEAYRDGKDPAMEAVAAALGGDDRSASASAGESRPRRRTATSSSPSHEAMVRSSAASACAVRCAFLRGSRCAA
jgi:hypothetical protein